MKKLFRKLKQKAGESLVETLCAILIFTLASVSMYSMVMSAAKINATAKEADQESQRQMAIAEKGLQDDGDGTVVMIVTDSKNVNHMITVNVDICGEDGDLYAYYKKP